MHLRAMIRVYLLSVLLRIGLVKVQLDRSLSPDVGQRAGKIVPEESLISVMLMEIVINVRRLRLEQVVPDADFILGKGAQNPLLYRLQSRDVAQAVIRVRSLSDRIECEQPVVRRARRARAHPLRHLLLLQTTRFLRTKLVKNSAQVQRPAVNTTLLVVVM